MTAARASRRTNSSTTLPGPGGADPARQCAPKPWARASARPGDVGFGDWPETSRTATRSACTRAARHLAEDRQGDPAPACQGAEPGRRPAPRRQRRRLVAGPAPPAPGTVQRDPPGERAGPEEPPRGQDHHGPGGQEDQARPAVFTHMKASRATMAAASGCRAISRASQPSSRASCTSRMNPAGVW